MTEEDWKHLEDVIAIMNAKRLPPKTIPRTPDEIRVDELLRKMHNEEV